MTVSTRPRPALLPAAGLLAILAVTGPTAARAETELRWKFEKDQTLRYDFAQTNKIKVQSAVGETENVSELKLDLTWKVKEVKDDAAEVELTVERVQTDIKGGPQPIRFDSKDDKEPEGVAAQALANLYKAVVGTPYTLTIDRRGQIQDVKIPEKVTTALEASPFRAMADGGSVLSPEGVKNMFAQVLPRLPAKPVEAGREVEQDEPLRIPAGPLRMELASKVKVEELKDDQATLSSTIETSFEAQENSNFEIKLNDQKGTGRFVFDSKAGVLEESKLEQSFDLTLTVGDQKISQQIELTAVMTLQK